MLDERNLEAEGSSKLNERDKGHRHRDQTKIRRYEQAGQNQCTD